MIKGKDEAAARSESAAEKAAATSALPRLIAHREKLEREGGSINRDERNHWIRIAVGVVLTIIAALYAYGSGSEKSTPVFPWVVTAVFGIATVLLGVLWDRANASRRRNHDELSEKMRQVGRRIDSAERKLRK